MTAQEVIATIRNEIERLNSSVPYDSKDRHDDGLHDAYHAVLSILSKLEKSNSKDFPTTDEEIKQFLATHPKVELPEKYKTPDWIFEQSVKPMNQEGLDEKTIRIEFHAIADKCFNEGIEGWEREKLIARHFYDLGCRRTAEKYDEIEYNRQRAEEQGSEELSDEISHISERYPEVSFAKLSRIAVHFAQWGAEHLKK